MVASKTRINWKLIWLFVFLLLTIVFIVVWFNMSDIGSLLTTAGNEPPDNPESINGLLGVGGFFVSLLAFIPLTLAAVTFIVSVVLASSLLSKKRKRQMLQGQVVKSTKKI